MTKKNPKFCILFATIAASLALGSAEVDAQKKNSTETNGKRSQLLTAQSRLSGPQQKWMKILPILSHYHKKRRIFACTEHVNAIRGIVRKHWSTDHSKFSEEIIGLESMFRAGTSSKAEIKKHIASKLKNRVIDVDQVVIELQQVFDSMHSESQNISNETLIACKIDCDLDPRTVAACHVDTAGIRYRLDKQQDKLVDKFYESVFESAVATGTGMLAGQVAGSQFGEVGRGPGGESTWTSTLMSWAGAAAIEVLTEEIMLSEVLETRKKLSQATASAVEALLDPLTGNGDELEGCDIEILKLSARHESLMINAICGSLKLDPKWANKHLPK